MSAVVLDTHVAVWYFLESDRLSTRALSIIEQAIHDGHPVYVPTICIVEIIYLVEKGRLPVAAFETLERALADPGSTVIVASLDVEVAKTLRSIQRENIPDMPDRIIAATALCLNLPLITRDSRIQANALRTVW